MKGHGWVKSNPDGLKARCGGPNICTACDFEAENARLRDKVDAARSILWMAREYAEAGGRGGPEMQDYEAAAEIIGESEGNGV